MPSGNALFPFRFNKHLVCLCTDWSVCVFLPTFLKYIFSWSSDVFVYQLISLWVHSFCLCQSSWLKIVHILSGAVCINKWFFTHGTAVNVGLVALVLGVQQECRWTHGWFKSQLPLPFFWLSVRAVSGTCALQWTPSHIAPCL